MLDRGIFVFEQNVAARCRDLGATPAHAIGKRGQASTTPIGFGPDSGGFRRWSHRQKATLPNITQKPTDPTIGVAGVETGSAEGGVLAETAGAATIPRDKAMAVVATILVILVDISHPSMEELLTSMTRALSVFT